jgi:hypothetical protein
MDKNKQIRITLLILNIVLAITPIVLWYLRIQNNVEYNNYNLAQRKSFEAFLSNLGFGALVFSICNFFIFSYIAFKNSQIRFNFESQKKEQESRRIAAEYALRMERERQIQHEKDLQLIKNFETAGKYEDAARICDKLELWEKAGEMRRLNKTTYMISTTFSMGKDGVISCRCPNCGSSQVVESKTNMVICKHCGHNYIIPKKVLDMM